MTALGITTASDRKETMALRIGSVGEPVRQLQGSLNLLPSSLQRLKVDGKFGARTQGRVMEFQRDNTLLPDGIVGDITFGVIQGLLRKLGLLPDTAGTVRSINQEILGRNGPDNMIEQLLPTRMMINFPTFVRNAPSNVLNFIPFISQAVRLGLFAAKKGAFERCVMLTLPKSAKPDTLLIVITQTFGQAREQLDPLGWQNPLSKKFIEFALLKHVVNRYAPQVTASKKTMGMLYILRADQGPELGPFANDGPFVKQVLDELVGLTNGAFSFGTVEAMTYSSGILEFPLFLGSINGLLNVGTLYNIDPAGGVGVGGSSKVQFLSGMTTLGVGRGGFEFMPHARWKFESSFREKEPNLFNYLHNNVMPNYCLHLGIQLS
jgi:putative peptidoglycan binding protein